MPQKFEKNIVSFRWIISKKDCVISVVDVGEMEVANIDNLGGLMILCRTHPTFHEELEPEQLFLCASHV